MERSERRRGTKQHKQAKIERSERRGKAGRRGTKQDKQATIEMDSKMGGQ